MSFKHSKYSKFSKTTKNEPEHDVDEDELEEDEKEEQAEFNVPPELRTIGLFGNVDEDKVTDLIGAIIALSEPKIKKVKNEEGNFVEQEEPVKPIKLMLNTPGGNADEMFALYDIMRMHRDKCEIHTFGVGKVMSAGVLLLAAGTKGQRKVGKHCRIMIHSVIGGNAGPLHNLENEMDEIRYVQNAYLKALADESNMSFRQLKKMIDKKVNVYLSAEEAVKLGIADIIV
jgi:ATP-dependent Clp protease protease subunit